MAQPKQITITIDETGFSMNATPNVTRIELIGALEALKHHALGSANLYDIPGNGRPLDLQLHNQPDTSNH